MINSIQDITNIILNNQHSSLSWGDIFAVEGNVDVISDSNSDLILFNYNREATFSKQWNWFERQSRGLIFDGRTGELVARPFEKFFNWGEDGRTTNARVHWITEKMDGSLGIGFFYKGQFRIVTRGSFDSPQSQWATNWIQPYLPYFPFNKELENWTFLFEILYHENQIVIDHGFECLFLLTIRHNQTGEYLEQESNYLATKTRIPMVRNFGKGLSVEEIIEIARTMEDKEGFVVEFKDGQRFKFKTDWYLERHHLFTSRCSKKQVFEAIRMGMYDDYRAKFDGPKAELIDMWAKSIREEYNSIFNNILRYMAESIRDLGENPNQKDFAIWVNRNAKEYSSLLFLYRSGKIQPENIFKHMEKTYDLSS